MSRNDWEVYWRCGYQVKGAASVTVDEYARTEERADKLASEAAEKVLNQLRSVGIAGSIEIWRERWRTRRVEESDGREVVDTWQVERAKEDDLQHQYDREKHEAEAGAVKP